MDSVLYEKLINASINFVSYRPRSEKEFREFLDKKIKKWKIFTEASTIDTVINRMRELGYIDDLKFAQWWIDQRAAHRPKGTMLIKRELLQKGISREIVNESVPAVSEKELAAQVLQKQWIKWLKLSRFERKKKAYAHLARRGFSADTIGRVIDDLSKLGYNMSEETDRI